VPDFEKTSAYLVSSGEEPPITKEKAMAMTAINERGSDYATFRIEDTLEVGLWLDHIDSLVDWFDVPELPARVENGVRYLVVDENDLACLVSMSRDDQLLTAALGVTVNEARQVTNLDAVERGTR